MNFILPKYLQKDITVTTIRPPYSKSGLLPFLDTVTFNGSFGCVLLQSFHKTDFAIYQHVFRMKQQVSVKVEARQPMITLSYVLKGIIPCNLNGFGKAMLAEGWYHLYYVPVGKHTAAMPCGEAVVFQINFNQELIQELGNKYEVLRDVCENVMNESGKGVQQMAAEITPRIKEILNGIYNCNLEDAELELFLRARIYDLLLLYLEELSAAKRSFNTRYHFSKEDLQALHEISTLLQERIHEPINQQVLARYVHLHPKKLAEGFRLMYGVTIHEWVSRARIDKAKKLLKESSIPIGEIALELGYTTTSIFTRAFKGMVGCTPKHYRK
ncbi:helix-turn-helix domain-containing protein [Chitinophaga nivalis]|uniref:AraC family transcriptional regulator n=1 Tax=Chitinophaga nivalis TaxID=2991709 RepID=A0ABT3IMC9_9BACT|nr:AraC family transcriptional regulator [Chitinophaga nivalis]MCW3465174.1 AraC family transcriptional regulator [Chitinophaga nivalis]MCW3485134.1 AraC family transcriptional regulator [Chitinophaga nivalis]